MGTPQKGNGDHKNRSAAGGRDTVSAVKAEDNASKVLPLQLKPSVDTVEGGGGVEWCHKLSLYGRI